MVAWKRIDSKIDDKLYDVVFNQTQLEKKMDINDCSKQQEILLKERSRIEAIVDERTKTIFKQRKEIYDDLRIIKEYILKKWFYSLWNNYKFMIKYT